MPSRSPSQARLMAACSHGAAYDACPPSKVSHEFNQADKGSGILRKAEGGPVMLPSQFGTIVQPRGAGALRRLRYDAGGPVPGVPYPSMPLPGALAPPQQGVSGPGVQGVGGPTPFIGDPSTYQHGPGGIGMGDDMRDPGNDWGKFTTSVPPVEPTFPSDPGGGFGAVQPWNPGGVLGGIFGGMYQQPFDDAGGGGGMARGGAVRQHFDQGGSADPAGGYGGDNASSGGWGAGVNEGLGLEGITDPFDPETFNEAPPSPPGFFDRMINGPALAGLLGFGAPGIGLGALLGKAAADWAEGRGIPTDRDPSTGISAGRGESRDPGLDRGGGDVMPAVGALTQPPPPVATPSAVLPPLPALRQPIDFDPTRYGFGPAFAWLR